MVLKWGSVWTKWCFHFENNKTGFILRYNIIGKCKEEINAFCFQDCVFWDNCFWCFNIIFVAFFWWSRTCSEVFFTLRVGVPCPSPHSTRWCVWTCFLWPLTFSRNTESESHLSFVAKCLLWAAAGGTLHSSFGLAEDETSVRRHCRVLALKPLHIERTFRDCGETLLPFENLNSLVKDFNKSDICCSLSRLN